MASPSWRDSFWKVKLWELLEAMLWPVIPALLGILCILPLSLPFISHGVVPWLGLALVFYWSSYAPGYLPVWIAALLGLTQDALYDFPLGGTALCYFVLMLAVHWLRRYYVQARFLTVWLVFGSMALLAHLLAWAVASISYGVSLPSQMLLVQWGMTLFLYPGLHLLCSQLFYLSPLAHRHAP